MNSEAEVNVRLLTPKEMKEAFPLVRVLREKLSEAEYLARLERQQRVHGYLMLGAFAEGRIVGLAGIREVETLPRGPHLHVDDLVVDVDWRHRSVGRRLLQAAAARASRSGFEAVYLDAIATAVPFYERLGFVPNIAALMRVEVKTLLAM